MVCHNIQVLLGVFGCILGGCVGVSLGDYVQRKQEEKAKKECEEYENE